jgi:hypothetical protein
MALAAPPHGCRTAVDSPAVEAPASPEHSGKPASELRSRSRSRQLRAAERREDAEGLAARAGSSSHRFGTRRRKSNGPQCIPEHHFPASYVALLQAEMDGLKASRAEALASAEDRIADLHKEHAAELRTASQARTVAVVEGKLLKRMTEQHAASLSRAEHDAEARAAELTNARQEVARQASELKALRQVLLAQRSSMHEAAEAASQRRADTEHTLQSAVKELVRERKRTAALQQTVAAQQQQIAQQRKETAALHGGFELDYVLHETALAVAEERSEQRLLAAAAQKMRRWSVAKALRCWRESATQQIARRCTVRKAARKMYHLAVGAALFHWQVLAAQQAETKQKLQRAFKYLRKTGLSRCFAAWRDGTQRCNQRRQLIDRSLRRWANSTEQAAVGHCFCALARFARAATRGRSLLLLWRHRWTALAFARWSDTTGRNAEARAHAMELASLRADLRAETTLRTDTEAQLQREVVDAKALADAARGQQAREMENLCAHHAVELQHQRDLWAQQQLQQNAQHSAALQHQRDLSEQQQLLHNAQHAAELQALAARTFEDATSTTLTAAAQHQEQAINDLNSLLR